MTPEPTVSNSFDYVPVREIPGFVPDPQGCPARGLGLSRAATSRVVVVRLRGRAALCRTTTSDFDDDEIRRTVHGCGQLYQDVSGRPSIEDFARDVRQLELAAACRGCPDLPSCTACYEPSGVSHFEEDEAWVRAHLASLAGRVLDVGMGQVPYAGAVAEAIRSGTQEYHGLDPDPAAHEAARATGLPVTLHEGVIEGFSTCEPFDHVVAIRSLGHFVEVEAAFAGLAGSLRRGGTLLLIESLALPLVRTRAHAELCHASARGGYQHYRNWGSERVLALVEGRHPLEVAYHRPVGRDTCDQWILKLVRT